MLYINPQWRESYLSLMTIRHQYCMTSDINCRVSNTFQTIKRIPIQLKDELFSLSRVAVFLLINRAVFLFLIGLITDKRSGKWRKLGISSIKHTPMSRSHIHSSHTNSLSMFKAIFMFICSWWRWSFFMLRPCQ